MDPFEKWLDEKIKLLEIKTKGIDTANMAVALLMLGSGGMSLIALNVLQTVRAVYSKAPKA